MIPTLFSVSYAGLWGQAQLGLPDFIRKAGELGYTAVELAGKSPHLSILDTRDADLDALRETAESAGVEIATIAAYTDFTAGASAAEVPFNEIQVAYVRELARMGARLGARIVRVFTGYTTNTESSAAVWDKCVQAVRACAGVVGEHGLVLGVQNHHDVAVSCDAMLEFLTDVDRPNCRAMFDPWAPALHGEDLRDCARRMAPHMVQTTLADYVLLKRFAYMPGLINYKELSAMTRAVPLGDGFIDLPGFFQGLREGGFDGYVAYEMCSPLRAGGSLDNLDATARKSLEVMKRLISPAD
jgi:sugar phosphate isomerase/epimerase